ncbi:MAG: hypothetical protein WKF94_16150 [Solirubrobacteraceae bacterium]
MRWLAGLLAVVALAGCGGDAAPAPPRPQLDPPQAAEPVQGPPAEDPPGMVVEVGDTPEGVALDAEAGIAAIAVDEPPRLVLVDVETGEITREVPLPGSARHVSVADGTFLVPVESADALLEVTPGGAAVRTPVGDGPHDATKLGDRVFTADEFGSTMSVVRDGELVGQVPVDAQPGGVDVVGDQVAVIAVRAYTVELYDGLADEPRGLGGQSAGLGPSHVVAVGDRLAIADTRGRALVVYGTAERLRFERRVALDGTPVGIAAGDDGTAWVALSERNEVVEVDLESGRVLRSVVTVRNPYTVAYRDGTLVIASQAEGTLQITRPG